MNNTTNDNWDRVINQLEPEDWKIILGPSYDTLRVLSSGKSICDWASLSFTDAYPPYEVILDKTKRDILIGKLPRNGIERLADALGLDANAANLYDLVRESKFRKNGPFEQALLRYFGIEKPTENERLSRPGLMILDSIEYGLRDYQRQVITDIQQILMSGSRRLIVQMPTGSGKTRTIMYHLANEMNSKEPCAAIWLAYSRELCDQASFEFEKAWQVHGNRRIKLVNAYEDGETLPEDFNDGLIVITLQKLLKIREKDPLKITKLSKSIDILVFDEAHQAVAPQYQSVVENILNTNSTHIQLIGLTATPGRTWNNPEEDLKLSEFFRKNLVKIRHDGWNSPNEMLTARGYLSKIIWKYSEFNNPILSDDEVSLIKNLREDDELPRDIIHRLSMDTSRNVHILKEVDDLLNEGKKRILVFCPSIENARLMCVSLGRIVAKYGGKVSELDGTTDSGSRDTILRTFKLQDHIPRVLCNYNILTTGFDAPNIDAGVIARPTKSLVLFSQMVGRMIRGPKTTGGTEYATIVSVVDTQLPGFKDSHDNWKDVWK